jgi:hypothetical protein
MSSLCFWFWQYWVWPQVLILAEQVLYYLTHSTSPVWCCIVYMIRSRELFSQSWLRTMILLISASWVTRITGVSHQPVALWICLFSRNVILFYCFYLFIFVALRFELGPLRLLGYEFMYCWISSVSVFTRHSLGYCVSSLFKLLIVISTHWSSPVPTSNLMIIFVYSKIGASYLHCCLL